MRLYEVTKGEYEIFLDIDGVFADFDKGVQKILDEPYSERRYEKEPKFKKKMWDTINKYRKDGKEFWFNLELLPDAMDLWNYTKKYNPTFLTATGTSGKEKTEDEKRRWVADKFGKNVPVLVVEAARDKKKHSKENRILVDDKEKAIKPWEEAGGIGILHTSSANTIKELKKLGL
jgi:hypothetical protein